MHIKNVRSYDCKKDEKKFRHNMTDMIFTSHLELERHAKVGRLKDNIKCLEEDQIKLSIFIN